MFFSQNFYLNSKGQLLELVAIFTLHQFIWGFLDNFPLYVLGRRNRDLGALNAPETKASFLSACHLAAFMYSSAESKIPVYISTEFIVQHTLARWH